MAAQVDEESSHGPWGEKLWNHRAPKTTAMWEFHELVKRKHPDQFQQALQTRIKNSDEAPHSGDYYDLYQWSVDHVSTFWEEMWNFVGVAASVPYKKALSDSAVMFPRPVFFEGARLNFAENLLFPAGCKDLDLQSPAIIAATETTRETVSWQELRGRVARCQVVLKSVGIKQEDRVAGYVGNHVNAVVAMLAATSLGAIWTAISPDSGVSMVLDRLQQIAPKVLFTDDGQMYNGKNFGVLEKVSDLLSQLKSIENVFVFNVIGGDIESLRKSAAVISVNGYEAVVQKGEPAPELQFAQLPADHPVYILFSSGTTGKPKCIVHGAIGTLLQHKKEHILHCSITPGARVFYFTTCTWMMWHWLISGLAAGATLILFDGSPMRYRSKANGSTYISIADDLAVPRLIDELQIVHFGTSAKYLSILEQKSIFPRDSGCSLASLQAVYNTASPLAPSTFRYVYKAFGPDINLGSITGGTDIISLFGAASPLTPVYAGEVQVPGLGMAVRAWTAAGDDITDTGAPGDLMCVKPFICQPVAFWGEDGQKKYKSSYFDRFDGYWHHGDFVQFNPKTGGMFMLGRSDGVLNPAGVRFGSAEIYNVLLKYFAGTVSDGLCIGRKREGEMDETVVLFVKMEEGKALDEGLVKDIKVKVRSELSARHVPSVVDECPDIPVTVNGKKVEGAVKQIISGSKIKTSASVANEACLEWYKKWAEVH